MKKLFFLIVVCIIEMMLPQRTSAAEYTYPNVTITIENGIVTINSDKAGALAAANIANSVKHAMHDATVKMEFIGDFNGADLEALTGNGKNNCCMQETVDMSQAKFVKNSSSSSSSSYILFHETPTNPEEGKTYLIGSTKYVSTPGSFSLEEIEESQGQGWQVYNILPEERSAVPIYSANSYIMLPTTLNYYIKENGQWVLLSSPSTEQQSSAIAPDSQHTTSNLPDVGGYGDNTVIKVRSNDCTYKYYKSVAAFTWTAANQDQDYHDYETTNYSYSSPEEAPAPTDYGQSIYVGGELKTYTNGQWTNSSQSGGDKEYDYSQMKFSYWGNHLKYAITSAYADNTILNEIFQNCNNLETVDYKSGNVTGLSEKSHLVSATIGKNVTSIDASAFEKSSIQTVTFDKNFETGEVPNNLTIGNSAFFQCENLTGIEFPNRVVRIGNNAFKEAGTSVDEFSVSFERREVSQGASVDYDVNLTIGESAFQNCTTMKKLSLPIRLTTLGDNVFAGTTNLTTVEIREDLEDSRLTVIPPGAFLDSGISTITIPRSVTLIRTGAFQECFNLEKIYFQESHQNPQPDLVIETRAFAGGDEHKYKLTDVFVNIDPKKRKLICEYDAFNFTSLVGQTDITSGQMATLHFSEDYWDYYAGDWKKGVSFTQTALNSFKDGCDPTKNALEGESMNDQSKKGTNDQIHASNGRIPNMSPGNGWHQFARTDTGIDIIIEKGKDFRTYSTEVALVKPSWMHIYRVTNFDDGFKENSNASSREEADSAKKVATTEEIIVGAEGVANCIPMNTGVIRVDNVANDAIYYIMEWGDLADAGVTYNEAWEYPYQDDLEIDKVNFMKPTTTPESNPEVTIIGPVEKNGSGEITHRVFGLKKVQNGNVITGEFLRAKTNTKMARNRAYLSLPADLFHWKDEGTSSTQGATGTIPANNTNGAKISLIIDADFEEDFLLDNNGIATAIEKAIEESEMKNGEFYTIQGVKVAKPTAKGIYIHNGKKVLIK